MFVRLEILLTKSLKKVYIASHRGKYHLEVYSTDEIIKTTIHTFLVAALNEIKSKFRKTVCSLS